MVKEQGAGEKARKKRKGTRIALIVAVVLLSQYALFWGLDQAARRILMPKLVFDHPYRLHSPVPGSNAPLSASESVSGPFALSYSGRYLAWIVEGELYVEDLIEHKKVPLNSRWEQVQTFRWLSDRNSLIFIAGSEIYSLSLEGGVFLQRENEIDPLPEQGYSDLALSTYTNCLYALAGEPDRNRSILRIDLAKSVTWLLDTEGGSYTRLALSNKFGYLATQADGPGERRIYEQRDTERQLLSTGFQDVLLGADDTSIFVGVSEGAAYTEIKQYTWGSSGYEVIWQGEIPISAQFVQLAAKIGFIVTAAREEEGQIPTPEEAASGAAVYWAHYGGLGHSQITRLPRAAMPALPGELTYFLLAPSGLTYLEITGDRYCWRLLVDSELGRS